MPVPRAQPLDARYRLVDHAGEFRSVFTPRPSRKRRLASSAENQVRFRLDSFGFAEPQHFTEMRVDGKLLFWQILQEDFRSRSVRDELAGECSFFDPPMHSGLLERLQRRGLSMGQPRLGAALGKRPAPAAAGSNQQELDASPRTPVANRSHLFALAQFAKLRKSNKRARRLMCRAATERNPNL